MSLKKNEMKKILIIPFLIITKVIFAQSYHDEPIKFNNLIINGQEYTDDVVEQGLGLEWSKIKKDRTFDGEYHLGHLNQYRFFPSGNFDNNLDFKFSITISDSNDQFFVTNAVSETKDVNLVFLGHTFIIGQTTKSFIDSCLSNGKDLVDGDPTYYRLYTDQGYLYLGFDESTEILTLIELDCDCQ